jgi:hypothetical protein
VVMNAGYQPPGGDWREGAATVAVLSFDVDAEAPIFAEGDQYAEDLSTMSLSIAMSPDGGGTVVVAGARFGDLVN